MSMALLMFIVAFSLSALSTGSADYKGKESWGYVDVRKDAHMFWWLYYTDVSEQYYNYPLVVWLQGGPGASSCGYGNFMEIGPLDQNLKPRNTTWVKKANLLFLDNPVGTGFSYVTNTSALARNNSQIAADLVTALASLLKNIPEFQKAPLYIFGESYGGKMAVDFAIALNEAVKKGKVVCNFKGIALGDSWISPYDSVSTWGQYLYTMSLLDKAELEQVNVQVAIMKKDLVTRKYAKATELFNSLQNLIANFTGGVDFYNVLRQKHKNLTGDQVAVKFPKAYEYGELFKRQVGRMYSSNLSSLMNGPIREKLHVIPKNVTWGGQSSAVFQALAEDFMKPVVDSVDYLLNETKIDISVYSGQLDVIVDTVGTMNWIQKLKWPGVKQFMSSKKQHFGDSHGLWGFGLSFKNFHFYHVLRAGHMVPTDAGHAALQMLEMIVGEKVIHLN